MSTPVLVLILLPMWMNFLLRQRIERYCPSNAFAMFASENAPVVSVNA